jgi:outer membrane protein assembly factor BamB
MTDNDQTQWAAFDQALDEMAAGDDTRRGAPPWVPSSKGGDADLISTARHLNALHAQQGAIPDDDFVIRLEHRLMPDASAARAATDLPATVTRGWATLNPLPGLPSKVTINGDATNPGPHPQIELGDPINVASPFMVTPNQRDANAASPALAKRPLSLIAPAISMALLLALIAATGFIVWQGNGSKEPRSIAFPAASDGTPVVAAAAATPENDGFLWELPASSEAMILGNSGFTVEGNTVYRFLRIPTEFNGIEAIDGLTGQTRWRATAYWWRDILAADGHGVYYFGFGETTREGTQPVLIALSPETGDELWRLDVEDQPRNVSAKDGRLYFDTYEDDLIAIDTVKGEEVWRYEGGDHAVFRGGYGSLPGSLPVISDHAIVMFTTDGSLVGLDPESGTEIWSSQGYTPEATFLTAAGDTLVAMSVFAWEGMTSPSGTPSPDIMETLSGARTAAFRVVGINSADGRVLWEQNVAAPIQYPAASGSTFAVIGVRLFPGEVISTMPAEERPSPQPELDWASDHVQGFDVRTGELLWVVALTDEQYRTLSAWEDASGSGEGIAATTSSGDIVPVGPWTGGHLVSPEGYMLVSTPPIAGDFGFVAMPIDGRMVGIAVEPVVDE